MPKAVRDNLGAVIGLISILTVIISYSISYGMNQQRMANCEEKVKTLTESVDIKLADVKEEIRGLRDDGNSRARKQDETNNALHLIKGKLGLN